MRKSAPLFCALLLSLSARRAWIEIPAGCWRDSRRAVALRKESVDRNSPGMSTILFIIVALRKESVDRNIARGQLPTPEPPSLSARRAWIEIEVSDMESLAEETSLSARRAWIEIPAGCWRDARRAVALRKESVDRNPPTELCHEQEAKSLSARRAWIEIMMSSRLAMLCVVALRKESVDRNYRAHGAAHRALSRSPQGERG